MRLVLATLAILIWASAAKAQHWRDPDLGRAVIEGVADAENLWLRGATGAVVRFDRLTGERTVVLADAVDLLTAHGRLWAMAKQEAGGVAITDLKDERRELVRLYPEGDPLGLVPFSADLPAVLTNRNVHFPDGTSRWRRQALAGLLETPSSIAVGSDGAIYVGYSRGEWGGGLRRIDPMTGSIAFVTVVGEKICGGRLNPVCAPVVGVFADEHNPGCVIVGTSLAHLSLRNGHVLRACGDEISLVYEQPYQPTSDDIKFPDQTWPFDGLVATPDGWIAVGQDQYARSRSGSVEMRPSPPLHDWAGLRVSEEQDGVLFVMAACCWGRADNPTRHRLLAIPVAVLP